MFFVFVLFFPLKSPGDGSAEVENTLRRRKIELLDALADELEGLVSRFTSRWVRRRTDMAWPFDGDRSMEDG